MNETERTELSDEVKRLAIDLLSNETLVVRQAARNSTQGSTQNTEQSTEQEILFYGRTEIGGDTVSIVNNGSPAIARLCSSLLTASAVNRQAGWNFILKALS
ncbi:MAG: hypothetical protein AB2L20_17830 [Mangrovibacterium sp.]